MSETEFTPGPWAVYNENEGDPKEYGPLWCVANEAYHTTSDDEAPCFQATIYHGCKADADLVAASPKLYAALEQAMPLLTKEYLETTAKYAGTRAAEFPEYKAIISRYEDARAALAEARGEA